MNEETFRWFTVQIKRKRKRAVTSALNDHSEARERSDRNHSLINGKLFRNWNLHFAHVKEMKGKKINKWSINCPHEDIINEAEKKAKGSPTNDEDELYMEWNSAFKKSNGIRSNGDEETEDTFQESSTNRVKITPSIDCSLEKNIC